MRVCVCVFHFAVLCCPATGDGEKIMQFCPSFQTVAYLRQGMAPMEAVEYVFRLIREKNGGEIDFDMTLVVLSARVRDSIMLI